MSDRRPESTPGNHDISRRSFIKGAGVGIAAAGLAGRAVAFDEPAHKGPGGVRVIGPAPTSITLRINGATHEVEVAPSATLLDTLRDRLRLTGAKRVCDRGACGACTVLLDGEPVNSCSLLAVDAAGHELTTVEGLARNGELTPVQRAFVETDALQCGFCTPGMVLAVTALLRRNPKPSRAQTARALAGNLCRCGTYDHIFEAVAIASGQKKPRKTSGNPARGTGEGVGHERF